MNDAPSDPDRKRIHISDGFRRAKRNLLFWSGLTILLCVGSQRQAVEASPFARNLTFDPTMLVVFALVALVISFSSFVRAKGEVDRANSHFARESQVDSAIAQIESLIPTLTDLQQRAALPLATLDRWRELVQENLAKKSEAIRAVANAFEAAPRRDFELIIARAVGAPDPLHDPSPLPDIATARILEAAISTSKDRFNSRCQTALLMVDVLEDELKQITETPLDEIQPITNQTLSTLGNIAADLRNWSRDIDVGEKRWFQFEDVALPRIAFGIACLISAVRIFMPTALDHAIDAAFPYHVNSSIAKYSEDTHGN